MPFMRRVLWVLTGLLVLMPPTIASAGRQQALVI